MKGISSLLNLLFGTSQDFFDDEELPWPLEILQAEVTEGSSISNVSEILVKKTVFQFHASATPAREIKGTIWGLSKPFELTLRASNVDRGSLVVTNKTSGLNLPVDGYLQPPNALLLSIREEAQAGSGVFLLPLSFMPIDEMEATMQLLIESTSGLATAPENVPEADDLLPDDVEDDLLSYFHIVIFLFGNNTDLLPDTEETFTSLDEAFAHHDTLKSMLGVLRAA